MSDLIYLVKSRASSKPARRPRTAKGRPPRPSSTKDRRPASAKTRRRKPTALPRQSSGAGGPPRSATPPPRRAALSAPPRRTPTQPPAIAPQTAPYRPQAVLGAQHATSWSQVDFDEAVRGGDAWQRFKQSPAAKLTHPGHVQLGREEVAAHTQRELGAIARTVRRKEAQPAPLTGSTQRLTAPAAAYYPKPPRVGQRESRQSGDTFTLACSERVTGQGINTSFNTKGAAIFRFIGNPTAFNTPQAGWAAANYDQYEIESCTLRWASGLPTASFGRIGAAFDIDSFDSVPVGEYGITMLASHKSFSESHAFIDHEWHMPSRLRRKCWTQLLIPGTTTATVDPGSAADARSTDQFNFVAVITLPISGTSITIPAPTAALLEIGAWYVDYRITFSSRTAEALLLGSGMWSSYNASTNLTFTSGVGGLGVNSNACYTTYPSPQNLGAASAALDYWATGKLGTYIQHCRLAADAVTTDVPAAAGWYPCFPTAPCRLWVTLKTATAPTFTGSLLTRVYVVNPDDPTDVHYVSIAGSGHAKSGNAVYLASSGAFGYDGASTTASASGVYHACVGLAVDPTGFRYNPSRLVIVVDMTAATFTVIPSFSASIEFTPLSLDQQMDLGIPHYNATKQPLTGHRVVRPTLNKCIGSRAQGAGAVIDSKPAHSPPAPVETKRHVLDEEYETASEADGRRIDELTTELTSARKAEAKRSDDLAAEVAAMRKALAAFQPGLGLK